jgi:hypothetical protein
MNYILYIFLVCHGQPGYTEKIHLIKWESGPLYSQAIKHLSFWIDFYEGNPDCVVLDTEIKLEK